MPEGGWAVRRGPCGVLARLPFPDLRAALALPRSHLVSFSLFPRTTSTPPPLPRDHNHRHPRQCIQILFSPALCHLFIKSRRFQLLFGRATPDPRRKRLPACLLPPSASPHASNSRARRPQVTFTLSLRLDPLPTATKPLTHQLQLFHQLDFILSRRFQLTAFRADLVQPRSTASNFQHP